MVDVIDDHSAVELTTMADERRQEQLDLDLRHTHLPLLERLG